jgi:hypothetical protein
MSYLGRIELGVAILGMTETVFAFWVYGRMSYLKELWRIRGRDSIFYSHLYCITFLIIIFIK